jgi:hypothetical protein
MEMNGAAIGSRAIIAAHSARGVARVPYAAAAT